MNNKSEKNESQPQTKNVLFKTTLGAPLNSERSLVGKNQEDVTSDYVAPKTSTDSSQTKKQSALVTGDSFLQLNTENKIELTGTLIKAFKDQKQSSVLTFIGFCIGLYFLKENFERGELSLFCSNDKNKNDEDKINLRTFYKYAQVGEVFKDMKDYAHVGTFTTSEIVRICDLPEVTRNVIFAHKIRLINRKLERLKTNYKNIIGDEVIEEKILKFLTRFRDAGHKKNWAPSGAEIDVLGDTDSLERQNESNTENPKNETENTTNNESDDDSTEDENTTEDTNVENVVMENLMKLSGVGKIISTICVALTEKSYDSETTTSVTTICMGLRDQLDEAIKLALVFKGHTK